MKLLRTSLIAVNISVSIVIVGCGGGSNSDAPVPSTPKYSSLILFGDSLSVSGP
jgi:phospholipase/lecithinase/hemolysin